MVIVMEIVTVTPEEEEMGKNPSDPPRQKAPVCFVTVNSVCHALLRVPKTPPAFLFLSYVVVSTGK